MNVCFFFIFIVVIINIAVTKLIQRHVCYNLTNDFRTMR